MKRLANLSLILSAAVLLAISLGTTSCQQEKKGGESDSAAAQAQAPKVDSDKVMRDQFRSELDQAGQQIESLKGKVAALPRKTRDATTKSLDRAEEKRKSLVERLDKSEKEKTPGWQEQMSRGVDSLKADVAGLTQKMGSGAKDMLGKGKEMMGGGSGSGAKGGSGTSGSGSKSGSGTMDHSGH